MKWLLNVLFVGIAGWATAQDVSLEQLQDSRVPVRIPVHHADPWMIKMMLEGTPINQPEYSTLRRGGTASGQRSGQPGPGTQRATKGFLTRGHLMVNPTDNSIWYIPDKT